MPSPFPGMDPYLENPKFWSGFHTRLIVAISSHLSRILPKGLYVDVDEHVWLRDESEQNGHGRKLVGWPDLHVVETGPRKLRAPRIAGRISLSAPSSTVTVSPIDPRRVRYLTIVDDNEDRVITAIELLSPANKSRQQHYDVYTAKREEYFAGRTSLVEIDLLRAGVRMPYFVPHPPPGDYYLFVCAAHRYPQASVWAFSVKDRIPNLEIPLRATDDSVVIDLNALVHSIYDENRYRERIDYSRPAKPAFRGDMKDWIDRRLAKVRKDPETP